MFALLQSDFSDRNILETRFFSTRKAAVDAMVANVRQEYEQYYDKNIEEGDYPCFDELYEEAEGGSFEAFDFGFDEKEGTAWSNINDDREYDWRIIEVPASTTETHPEDESLRIHFEYAGKPYNMTAEEIYAAYTYQNHSYALATATIKFFEFALGVDDPNCLSLEDIAEAKNRLELTYGVSYDTALALEEEYLAEYQELYSYIGCNAAENDLWDEAIKNVLSRHKRELTVADVVSAHIRWRNANLDESQAPVDPERCKTWLLEYQTANDLTLNQLAELFLSDPEWVFEQISLEEK